MNLRSFSKRRAASAERERGAAFLEFALVVPILTLLAMGIVEFGLAWTATNEVNSAVRDAARAGSSSGAYYDADAQILRQLASRLPVEQREEVQRIVVFKASSADGKVPPACLSVPIPIGGGSPPFGVAGVCNVYNWGVLESVRQQMDGNGGSLPPGYASAAFSNQADGCSGKWDSRWCPSTRQNNMRTNKFDYVGVYVETKHKDVAHFGFGDQTIRRSAVFRLEPEPLDG